MPLRVHPPECRISGCSATPFHLVIGQDREGRWMVRDTDGLIGGIFRDRGAAERFAAFESGHRPQLVHLAPQSVRLDLTGPLPRFLRKAAG